MKFLAEQKRSRLIVDWTANGVWNAIRLSSYRLDSRVSIPDKMLRSRSEILGDSGQAEYEYATICLLARISRAPWKGAFS